MWNGKYGFFDNYRFIEGYSGQDYSGLGRIVFLIFTFVTIPLILFLFRKASKRSMDIYLKVVGIVLPLLEIAKLSYESYFDIKYGSGFSFGGLLPLYTCSLFIYTSFAAGYGKGIIKEYALSWIATIGFVGGMSNVIFTQGLTNYPFFTFSAMHNMFFHYMMVLTSLLIVFTKYKEFTWKDLFKGFIVNTLFSLIVIPLDYIFEWDYMLFYRARGVPVIQDFVVQLANANLRWVTIPLITAFYLVLSVGLVSLYVLYNKATPKKHIK